MLRAGAAKRSMELLLETELLEILAPEMVRSLKDDSDGDEAVLRRARFWGYLAALDQVVGGAPGAAVERAAAGGDACCRGCATRSIPTATACRDRGHLVSQAFTHGVRAAAAVAPGQRDRAADPARPPRHPALEERTPAPAAALARVRGRGAAARGDRLAGRGGRPHPGGPADHRRGDAAGQRGGARCRGRRDSPARPTSSRRSAFRPPRSRPRSRRDRRAGTRGYGARARQCAAPRRWAVAAAAASRWTSARSAAAARSLASPVRPDLPRHRGVRRPLGLADRIRIDA